MKVPSSTPTALVLVLVLVLVLDLELTIQGDPPAACSHGKQNTERVMCISGMPVVKDYNQAN